jgi:hypothetical protein
MFSKVLLGRIHNRYIPVYYNALHIWNAQDLYFHKKWVNRTAMIKKFVVMTTFVHQIYLFFLAIPAQWTTVQPPHFCLRHVVP